MDKIKNFVNEHSKKLNLDLYDIEFEKEHGEMVLRVMVDKEPAVTIDECVKLNNLLCDQGIDNLIDKEFNLEVCSPGIERKLRNLTEIKNSIGKYIYIKTFASIEGQKEFEDYLIDVKDQLIILKNDLEIEYKKIATIRWAIDFSKGVKK